MEEFCDNHFVNTSTTLSAPLINIQNTFGTFWSLLVPPHRPIL